MSTSKEYIEFLKEQFAPLGEVTTRAMMGEYVLYYKGRIVGGVYDNRLLVKPVEAAKEYMPNAKWELPYEGAKEMLLVENVDSSEYICGLLEAMYPELPEPKPKKPKVKK